MQRCAWANRPELVDYHDQEWNQAVMDNRHWFEHLCIAIMANTLPVEWVLRKRDAFAAAFGGFNPAYVASCGETELEMWLQDPRLIRNRAKLTACIQNAQAWLGLTETLGDDVALWQWLGEGPVSMTALATAKCKELKQRGFQRMGPSSVHDWLLAIGIRPGHAPSCSWRTQNR